MTDRPFARIDPSYPHACHAVMTEVDAQGLEPSHLHLSRANAYAPAFLIAAVR
jgi:hypothetical protein